MDPRPVENGERSRPRVMRPFQRLHEVGANPGKDIAPGLKNRSEPAAGLRSDAQEGLLLACHPTSARGALPT